MSSVTPLDALRTHPAFGIADALAEYVGVKRDLVQFVEFLSLAAGRMVMPVNVDVQTERVAVDLFIANRILDLRPRHVARVDTHRQFRHLEREGFTLSDGAAGHPDAGEVAPLAAVLVRGNHRLLHREVSEYTARLVRRGRALPSVWRVTDLAAGVPAIPSCLRVRGGGVYRGLDRFGTAFASHRECPEEDELAGLLDALPVQPRYDRPFESRLAAGAVGSVAPELMLVAERLLTVVTALRLQRQAAERPRPEVTPADYAAVRALLTNLPLTPVDRALPPQALVTAGTAFAAVAEHGTDLPDISQSGGRWFTRRDCAGWTGLGYNTVKAHLRALEDEGVLRSTVAENNRERGRQIHYRFAEGRAPPFAWKNPFEELPDLGPTAPT